MKFFFSIITSVFLFLGITPIALAANGPALNADRASTEYTASALTKCSENPKFIERANSATTQKDIARFERYGKASCGDDGLPHLIIGPPLEPWGALLNRGHEGDLLIVKDGKNRSVSVFKGKNLKTGEIEEFKGVFERVEKKKAKK